MNLLRIVLAIFGVCSLLTETLFAQSVADPIDPARKAYVASKLYAAARQYFVHWEDNPGFDLDKAYQEYLREAFAAGDRRSFSLASCAFVARFGNSHTWFADPTLLEGAGNAHGFHIRVLDGSWTVVRSDVAGLRPGDVVQQIDGVPIEDFYRRYSRFISASTERHRRVRLFSDVWRHLFPLRYTLKLGDGRSVVVDRGGEKRPHRNIETAGRWIEEGRIAYIKVPSWNGPGFQDRAMELLREFRTARGLIVDVRGNEGGSSPIAFLTALMDRPWRWWAEATTVRFGLFSYYAESGRSGYSPFAQPMLTWPSESGEGDSLFTGRLILLVDEGSHSASEDFVMPFKDNGRATIVGTPTAGSTGQPYRDDLGDRMFFAFGTKREYFPDGGRFEGVGIVPDVLVTPGPEDLRKGVDVELEKALWILREEQ